MISRSVELKRLFSLLQQFPVVGLIGARQVGKTTLARQIVQRSKGPTHFFDLENLEDVARLSDPLLALKNLRGLIVLDEIQRNPGIFRTLRFLADRPRRPAKFLILGSASPHLLRQSAESLAGRIAYHELFWFGLDEVGVNRERLLWVRGGFPGSFLAKTADASLEWRRQFIQTFLERDLPQLGISVGATTMRRFWMMLAHCHGQVWNASEFGRSFGVADTTVRRYLDNLSSALVVRQLSPWHENLSKRQIKAPKIYVADSGLLHSLLNLPTAEAVESHPKTGASWEGFQISQIVRHLNLRWDECFFWGTHAGAELDLLVVRDNKRVGFEIKRTSSPRITPSMQIALKDLKLKRLDIIHGGEHTFDLSPHVKAIASRNILSDLIL